MTNLKVMEDIVRYIKYGDNVMNNVREVASTYKDKFYPLLFVATTENGIPFRYYLSVFDIIYTFNEFVTGMDVLFKSFFVFDVAYPTNIWNVYTFLQQFMYGIYLKSDGKDKAVINLIESLDRTRLSSENEAITM